MKTCFILIGGMISFFILPAFADQPAEITQKNSKTPALSEKDQKAMEQDVKELEALTGENQAAVPAQTPASGEPTKENLNRNVAANATQNPEFYKFFGKDMSIRGDGKFIYIKAGPSSIVVDSKGRVQIKSADNVFMQSKKSIFLQADENINMMAGGEIIQTKAGGPKPASEPMAIEVKPSSEIKTPEMKSPEVMPEVKPEASATELKMESKEPASESPKVAPEEPSEDENVIEEEVIEKEVKPQSLEDLK